MLECCDQKYVTEVKRCFSLLNIETGQSWNVQEFEDLKLCDLPKSVLFNLKGVALLPFVDERRLRAALADVYPDLTPEEGEQTNFPKMWQTFFHTCNYRRSLQAAFSHFQVVSYATIGCDVL